MKRYVISFVLVMLLALPCPVECGESTRRGLFVSMIQDPVVLSSRSDIKKLIDFAKKAKVKILFVQVYRANQAWFPSEIADSTPYRDCLKKVPEDPLRFLIKEAHRSGLEVHAWLNMLSLGENKNAPFIKKYGTGILTRNTRRKFKLENYRIDNQYFLEPGDLRIREDLAKMVEEIVHLYPDLDGVQFDYVRYPDEKPAYGYTKTNMDRFKSATGLKTIDEKSVIWKDWKRAQVTESLKAFVRSARAVRPSIKVSATGCMPYSRAYHEAFQDWPLWLNEGIVDFVTVMNYSSSPAEFESWISAVRNKTKNFKKVNIGIGAYKLADSPSVFRREFLFSVGTGAGLLAIFHYGSLLQSPELSNFLMNNKGSNKNR
ncbi:MAG: family 10 glycosylhydrolase [Candidatus Omnitrophota bacterium]